MYLPIRKLLVTSACAVSLMGIVTSANAANWLMLQGTEPAGTAERAHLWGFIQVEYQKDTSEANAAGGYIPPKLIGPNLTSQSAFNVSRARIGVRGAPIPLDNNINYFLLAEFGNNGITYESGSTAKLTDASVTFNHIPGFRVRTGLFKYPGAEESLQAIHTFDYVNFTEVTNQLLLERFPNRSHPGPTGNVNPCDPKATSACNLNAFDRPVGAFRDVGIQIFDAIRSGDWETTYAVMYGNGNGLEFSDLDDNKDLYYYFSTEKVYGEEGGPFREGLKLFAWSQTGKRSFDGDNNGTREKYNRDRSGLGLKYLKKPWRFTTEFMKGDGMIWNGPDKPAWSLGNTAASTTNPNADDNGLLAKANGWYVEGGWYIPGTNWELDLRFDQYHRLDGRTNQLDWDTWTAGAQYHINKKTRLTFNYAVRDIEAPKFAPNVGPNAQLSGINNRIAVQVTAIY